LVVGRDAVEVDVALDAFEPEELADDLLGRLVEHVDVDGLAGAERADDLDVGRDDGVELAGPRALEVGPRDPRALVGLPLGGHPEAAGGGAAGGEGRGISLHGSAIRASRAGLA